MNRPTSQSALDPAAAEKFRQSGRIACAARDLGASMIEPGRPLRAVVEAVEAETLRLGGSPAFPAQTSRNHIAAHYCPSPSDELLYEEGDMVKLDVGVEVEGYVSDTATTIYLGDDERMAALSRAPALALERAIEVIGPGVPIVDVSTALEETITAAGFRPVYNLTGHGVDRWTVHCAPQIPASPDPRQRDVARPGMVLAIEPFATDGRGIMRESGKAEVFMLTSSPRKLRGIDRTVFRAIEKLHGLPFARRSLNGYPKSVVEQAIATLCRSGHLMSFPPLCDADKSARVSQAEHSVLILEDRIEVITKA